MRWTVLLIFLAACGGSSATTATTVGPTTTAPVPIVGSPGQQLCESLRRLSRHDDQTHALQVGREAASQFSGAEYEAASVVLDGFDAIQSRRISEAQQLAEPTFRDALASVSLACGKLGAPL